MSTAKAISDSEHTEMTARGREADSPGEIPVPGWRDVVLRVKDEMTRDNVSVVAAGVAFYAVLSLFPLIAATVSIYGLMVDPQQAQEQLSSLGSLLPADARQLVDEQLQKVTGGATSTLGLAALGSLVLTLWSAGAGVKALMAGLNIVYGEREKRGFITFNSVALGLTLLLIVFVIVALSLVAALPALVGMFGLPPDVDNWLLWLRWPLLALTFMAALAALYRYAPSRSAAKWRWVTWGAAGATLIWLVGSGLFSWYITNFGKYNETYGSMGALVILMLWFWISALIALMGAEFNAETEHQTRQDSTTGRDKPMGHRGAVMADTLGEKP
jgi:membrane protein